MRRRDFIALAGAAGAWPLAARAQAPERMRRIGVLMGIAESDAESRTRIAALQAGLRDLGWLEGRDVRIEYRWTAGDVGRARAHAAELVNLAPDVIVCNTTPVLEALRQATRSVPIVFVLVIDPVGGGFVETMARPGGNVTGLTVFEFSIGGKWVEMLKEVAPNVARAAFVFNATTAPFARNFVRAAEAVAPSFPIELVDAGVREADEMERTLKAFAETPNGGLIVLPDAFTAVHREFIIALAARYQLPAIYPFRYFSTLGGLVSYGIVTTEAFRRAAAYVDRILKGAKPADMPVQAPSKFELIINLRTAKALGLEIPTTLVARADEVIE